MKFTRPPRDADSPKPHSGTFDLLGFTHYWRRSRGGNWVIQRKTAKDRYARTLRALHQWCRANRHRPVSGQWRTLCRKLEGHYRYFGVTGNARRIHAVWFATKRRWRYWLARRSQHGQMPWSRFSQLLARYPLPPPRLLARHRA